MLDRKKLAVIHITKKELALSDREYRDILEEVTGVRSAKELDESGFKKLMRYFTRSSHYRLSRDGRTLRQK
ncbi:MAG: regulatory protein GemA, partial [Desulfobulbaceae bacterium]|nr:regulatory protein GemA [Desulfobulbaceae bacterium]